MNGAFMANIALGACFADGKMEDRTMASLMMIEIFLCVVGYLIFRDIRAWWRWKNRDPEDRAYWSVDQWADYFYNNPDETL